MDTDNIQERNSSNPPYSATLINCPSQPTIRTSNSFNLREIDLSSDIESEPDPRLSIPFWRISASRDSFAAERRLSASNTLAITGNRQVDDSIGVYDEENEENVLNTDIDFIDEVYYLFGDIGILVWECVKDYFPFLSQARLLPLRILDKYIHTKGLHRDEFVEVLPSLAELISHMSYEDSWGSFLVKVILDLYDDFLRDCVGPLFATYQDNFIPVTIHFYSLLDSVVSLNYRTRAVAKALGKRNFCILKNRVADYIEFYEKKQNRLARLTEGLNEEMFYL
jgi:hypothetical protein